MSIVFAFCRTAASVRFIALPSREDAQWTAAVRN
jgi:hypothetical protein